MEYLYKDTYRLAVIIIFAMPCPIRPQPKPTDPYNTPWINQKKQQSMILKGHKTTTNQIQVSVFKKEALMQELKMNSQWPNKEGREKICRK